MEDPDKEEWLKAMNLEIESMYSADVPSFKARSFLLPHFTPLLRLHCFSQSKKEKLEPSFYLPCFFEYLLQPSSCAFHCQTVHRLDYSCLSASPTLLRIFTNLGFSGEFPWIPLRYLFNRMMQAMELGDKSTADKIESLIRNFRSDSPVPISVYVPSFEDDFIPNISPPSSNSDSPTMPRSSNPGGSK
ncbi:hypothetical protein LWI29_020140 [Acer saccharum]|uniref:Uncharacterized protein n=1 Tax=Acer saccharum TaxID=4024 RepID=A0AA39SP37_ACESA|nr:hypothetical protein LWI29_020140 [Acer saccharum]